MPAAAPRVFVSYARRDGEAFARDLRERLAASGIPLWRDREGLEGGRDWWLQITEALDRVEFLVLVMTPAALASELVRREWRYARQRGVCVYPVQAAPGLDFAAMPRWMRSAHFYDLAHEWPKFVDDLNSRPQPRRVPFMVEEMPADHVPRRALLERLIPCLVDRARGEPVARVTALRGAGGFGKTALARAVCHDEEVQAAFDDGILWVTLGENPGDLSARVEDLIFILGGRRPGFAGLDAAAAALAELLAERELLIVIDDLWDAAHAQPFLRGGARCARLVTTRNLDTLPAGALRLDVAAMQRDEAVAVLGHGLPAGAADALAALAGRLGEWPLLLKLVNGALRERVQQGQALAEALAWVGKALDKRGLTFFDTRDAGSRERAVAHTLGLSLAQLNEGERARLDELAVFPEDQPIPLATLEHYWQRTGALDAFDTEALCERLHRLSLLLDFDPARRRIRLHDVIRQFLLERLAPHAPILHGALLEALRPASGLWADLAPAEPYLWDTLATHLLAAGRGDELVRTVLDLHYLAAKTQARHAYATEADLQAAEQAAPGDAHLRRWRIAFVQCQHLLARCDGAAALRATLYSRLPDDAAARPEPPALTPDGALPDLPHPALIRSLALPRGTLLSCAISPDGTRVAAGGDDGRIRLWETQGGRELAVLVGHTSGVRRIAFFPDGRRLVSAGLDRRLRLWNLDSGVEVGAFSGHTDGLTDCAVLPGGTAVVSTSLDGSVRLWDAEHGALRATFAREWNEERGGWLVNRNDAGHWAAVRGCAVSADGTLLASASSDQTVALWSLPAQRLLRVLAGHTAAVNGCAFSPDGTRLASAGADGTLRVWRVADGAPLHTLRDLGAAWNRCAFTPDGRQIVAAAADGRLLRWDAASGAPTQGYVGHTGAVNDCAVSADGTLLASAADDGSLRLWRLDVEAAVPPPPLRTPSSAFAAAPGLLVSARPDGALALRDARGVELRALPADEVGPALSCALTADARCVAVGGADGTVLLWNAAGSARLARLGTHRGAVNACAFDPSGTLLASASDDRTLRLSDLHDRTRRITFVAHRDAVTACAFSPDGRQLVSGAVDGTLRRWTVPADEALWEAWFAGRERLADAASLARLGLLEFGEHAKAVNQLAFAPDGSWLASASNDGSLRLWHWPDGRERQVLLGHGAPVAGCAVHPGGRWIASVADDGGIRIWQVGGRTVAALVVDGALAQCAWLSEERLAVAGAGGLYLLRWQP